MVQLNQRAACSRLLLEAPSSTGEIVDANKVLQESPRLLCTDNALQVVLSDRLAAHRAVCQSIVTCCWQQQASATTAAS
jgi:hypothetical protein